MVGRGAGLFFLFSFLISGQVSARCSTRVEAAAEARTAFSGRVVFLGYGAVARATLPILLRHVDISLSRITVLDQIDRSAVLGDWLKGGVTFHNTRITPENLAQVLGSHLKAGDLLIDLAWNIDAPTLLSWCHDHGVLYLNTSVEVWDPYQHEASAKPTSRTLYARHLNIRQLTNRWRVPGPTALLEHGANPGLISHFTKQGILDIARSCVREEKFEKGKTELIEALSDSHSFGPLAQELGIRVIHCSERDTQVSQRPKEVNEFVNTWSVPGFHEEGTTTSELGWGTHEKTLPPGAFTHECGPRNQICLARMGINTWVRSWVPYEEIRGMLVRHGEAFTLSDRLTVWQGSNAIYRPTVHYAYCPTDAAIASLWELGGRNYELQPKIRIMDDDITHGYDALGALIMGHPYQSWWTGSILSIEQSRELLAHQNATTIQVAIGIVSGLKWIIENPQRGVLTPEDVPHEYVMRMATPYLGNVVSTPAAWNPLQSPTHDFGGFRRMAKDAKDPWQFCNFLVQD